MSKKNETTSAMALHSAILGAGAYALMLYGLKQPKDTAAKRSALLAAGAFAYMGIWGHGLPTEARGPFFS